MNQSKVYKAGRQVAISPSSLPFATKNTKGAVKQGNGVAKIPWAYSQRGERGEYRVNDVIQSLRDSMLIPNDKFIVVYDMNLPNGVFEEDDGFGGSIIDETVYEQGDTTDVKFHDSEKEDTPYINGFRFKGWATTPDAVNPTYPYDEDDPETYTLTFTDSDIILYAVWEEKLVTLSYSLGEYGSGQVPSSQTVREGEPVNIDFSPFPTVNDGSGREFIGWGTSDGGDSLTDAQYRSGETSEIYGLYENTTLYPVFARRCTFSYSLGADATGDVPQGGTYYKGQSIQVDFYPTPTCLSDSSRQFLGWAMSPNASYPQFTSSGMSIFTLSEDVTLYPVFEAAQVTYHLTYSLGMYGSGSVPSPTMGTPYMGTYGVTYNVDFTVTPTCNRAGTWNFIGWSTTDGSSVAQYSPSGTTTMTVTPAANATLYPVFEEQQSGGGGALSVTNSSSVSVRIYHVSGKDEITDLEVSGGSSNSFTIDTKNEYFVTVGGKNYNEPVSFNGVYSGKSYNQSLNRYSKDNSFVESVDATQAWTFMSGDGGTITVSDYSGS